MMTTQQISVTTNNNNTKKCCHTAHHSNPIELTFHCAELPHIHIDQCVTLYNTGLYDDLALRHIDNPIGPTCAFHSTKGFPTKLISTAKQWTKWKRGRRHYGATNNTTRLILASKHHQPYATLLRHLRPEQELQPLPLKYFVGVTHSGHSFTPFNSDCWAKHDGREEVVEQLNPADYQFSDAKCFEPLQRVERAEELETHPLKAYCRNAVKRSVEEERETTLTTLIRQILRLASTATERRGTTGFYPPLSVFNGPYNLLEPADQLRHADIEALVCHGLNSAVNSAQRNVNNKNEDNAGAVDHNIRHELKKNARIFVTNTAVDLRHEAAVSNEKNNNNLQLVTTNVQLIHELHRASELQPAPIGSSCTDKRTQNGGETTDRIKGKKCTAKITVKTPENDATTSSQCDDKEAAKKCQMNGQKVHLLNRTDELKGGPIDEFVAVTTNLQTAQVGQLMKEGKKKKCSAKIVIKMSNAHHVTPSQCNDESGKGQPHELVREEELKNEPIEQFVSVTNRLTGSTNVEPLKRLDEKKYTAKIVVKLHNGTEQRPPKAQNGPQLEDCDELHSLRLSEELNCQPIGAFVTAASTLAQKGGEVTNNESEEVQLHNVLADEEKRMSRKRKRQSTSTTPKGVWQQIGATKDQKKKKKDKKKKEHTKKANKQNGQKRTATTTTASSSSSSSSSTDAEAEEIHVLVHDEEKQQQMPGKPTHDSANAMSGPIIEQDGPMLSPQSHTTTVRTWHEQSTTPQRVTTEVDEHGNVIRRVVTTEHVRHTVQTHSYQTMSTDDNIPTTVPITNIDKNDAMPTAVAVSATVSSPPTSLKSPPPVPPARCRSSATTPQAPKDALIPGAGAEGGQTTPMAALETNAVVTAFENGAADRDEAMNGAVAAASDDDLGELVSTKMVTTGNRTIETLTYKKEQDGIVETRVEHRITIHSNENIDHDAELDRAISEATKMNPNMKVEKVEVERSAS